MIIYIVGVSCVGKTTIGKMLSDKLGISFFDLDEEIQKYYQKPIERIQDECFSLNGYRKKGSVVLDYILSKSQNSVISGTPSGLKFSYLQVYNRHKVNKDLLSIHIKDAFENIVERLTFYDKDSNPVEEEMDESLKKRYLKDIKADYNYFKTSYERADLKIEIENLILNDIVNLILKKIQIKLGLLFSNKVLSTSH